MPKNVSLHEEAEVSIPLKTLISILLGVGISVTGYFQVTNRISVLENKSEMMIEEIEENDTWIDNFTPPPEVQDSVERVRNMEQRLTVIEHIITDLRK